MSSRVSYKKDASNKREGKPVPKRSQASQAPDRSGADWFQRVYFEQRVEEEFVRSRRYGMNLTFLLLHIPNVSRTAAYMLRSVVSNQLRVIDMFGLLGDGDYAICLPHTDHEEAAIVAAKVRTQMAGFSPTIGIATYGQDGTDLPGLLESAASRLS